MNKTQRRHDIQRVVSLVKTTVSFKSFEKFRVGNREIIYVAMKRELHPLLKVKIVDIYFGPFRTDQHQGIVSRLEFTCTYRLAPIAEDMSMPRVYVWAQELVVNPIV